VIKAHPKKRHPTAKYIYPQAAVTPKNALLSSTLRPAPPKCKHNALTAVETTFACTQNHPPVTLPYHPNYLHAAV
jgi:hypothetical protein